MHALLKQNFPPKTETQNPDEGDMGGVTALEDRPGVHTPSGCENIAVIRLGKDFLLELIVPAERNH